MPEEHLNNKPCILVKHAIQAFFQNTEPIFARICFFRFRNREEKKMKRTLKTLLTGCGQVAIIILNNVHIEVIE